MSAIDRLENLLDTKDAEIEVLQERISDLEAVATYCRDILDCEKEFNGNDWTLARKTLRILLGESAPEVGSRFRTVLEISSRGE